MTTATAQAFANIAFIKYWGTFPLFVRIGLPCIGKLVTFGRNLSLYAINHLRQIVMTSENPQLQK